MKVSEVARAKAEAHRFMAAVGELENSGRVFGIGIIPDPNYERGKLTAAVKRASADLSNVLVELRKSPGRK